jgi:hypothetical protein
MSILAKDVQKYTKYLRQCTLYQSLTLTLTHFELRVLLVDNEQTALATHDLAVG